MAIKKRTRKRKPTKAKVVYKVSTQTKVSLVVAMALAAFIGHSFALMSFEAIESFGSKKVKPKAVITQPQPQQHTTSTLPFEYDTISDIPVLSSIVIEDIFPTKPGKEYAFISGQSSATTTNSLYVLHNDGSVVFGFPKFVEWGSKDGPVIADVDNNGDMEIFVASVEMGNVYAFNHDGSVYLPNSDTGIFLRNDNYFHFNTVSLVNIDDTPELEVIALSSHGNYEGVYVFNHLGQELQYIPVSNAGIQPTIVDIDQDGELDILVVDNFYPSSSGQPEARVYAYDFNGNEKDGWPVDINERVYKPVVVGNIHPGNNSLEVMAISNYYGDPSPFTKLSLFSADGSEIIIDRIFYGDGNSPTAILSDVASEDNYPNEDIQEIVIRVGGILGAINSFGNWVQSWPSDGVYANYYESIISVDLDGVDGNEVIYGGSFKLYILSRSGHIIGTIGPNEERYTSLVVDDIDNDGMLEIIAGSDVDIKVIEFDVNQNGNIEWGSYQNDGRNTGNYYSTCSDGTYLNECSDVQPKYCVTNPNSNQTDYVKLKNNCGLCGCTSNFTCLVNGMCSRTPEFMMER